MKSIVVLVELQTDNPLLDPYAIDVSTVEATKALRQAVVDALPGLVGVVAVLPLKEAKLMIVAHNYAAKEAGLDHNIRRPPAGYRPPGRR